MTIGNAYGQWSLNDQDHAWLRTRSREWNAAWKSLAEASGDADFTAEHPVSGEGWQYMGTGLLSDRKGWQHSFRHRDHPRIGDRWYLALPASPGWKPEHEEVKRRVVH